MGTNYTSGLCSHLKDYPHGKVLFHMFSTLILWKWELYI